MAFRYLLAPLLLVAAICVWAAETKPPATARGEGESAEITATLYTDKSAITTLIGHPLDGDYIVIDVRLVPRGESPLSVLRDDFMLRSFKDGQRCQPFAPSQIAGQGTLTVSSSGAGGAMMGDNNGPVWGGTVGQPGRLGGTGGSMGNAGGDTAAQGTVQSGGKTRSNPTLDALKQKILPEKKTSEPVSGLLYFFLEGKHKSKDLQLVYSGGGGKIVLQFK
ncbi:MAG: hypothetical protein ABFD86_16040 [Bryobacteraceae bacterium]